MVPEVQVKQSTAGGLVGSVAARLAGGLGAYHKCRTTSGVAFRRGLHTQSRSFRRGIYAFVVFVVPMLFPSSSVSENVTALEADKSGYTVSQLATLRRASDFRGKLLDKGGVEVSSALGNVVLFTHPEFRHDAKYIQLKDALRDLAPHALAQVRTTLERLSFPDSLQQEEYHWQIFLEPARSATRGMLSSEHCHAAWMGPPSNIFLSVESFLSTCGSRSKQAVHIREELQEVLVHEIAHALEFRLMGRGFARRQRWHSEGFASWFESVAKADSVHREILETQTSPLFEQLWDPVTFNGTRQDYARSHALIAAISERESIEQLLQVYQQMDQSGMSFAEAVRFVFGWDLEEWNRRARSWLAEQEYGFATYPG